MRLAFKEWAVVVDALSRGEQIFIFRKGGLREGKGGFRVEHTEFLLFPTLFHQQGEAVLPAARERFEELSKTFAPDVLRIKSFARVAAWRRIEALAEAQMLRGRHIWRDEVIAERFEWGREKQIHVMAVRVFNLPHEIELQMLPSYGGCKSWVELEREIEIDGAQPALDDAAFARQLAEFESLAIANPSVRT
jgi:hypothetical protein